jgi:hypothetical protein
MNLESQNGPDGIFLGLSRSELTKFMGRRTSVVCENISSVTPPSSRTRSFISEKRKRLVSWQQFLNYFSFESYGA